MAAGGGGDGIVREFGLVMYISLYLKWITNKDQLYSTWNLAQCYVPAWMGRAVGVEWILVCAQLSPSTLPLKVPKNC